MIVIFICVDIESNCDEEAKNPNKLESLFNEFKSNFEIRKFLKIFKTQMKSHLTNKPRQEIKSFLNNFEKILKQQKDKFWKQAKIELVENNYDKFLAFVVLEIYNDEMFRCQFFEYVIQQQFSKITQIRDSLIVRESSELDTKNNEEEINNLYEESQEEDYNTGLLNTEPHAIVVKRILDKTVLKLSKPPIPNTKIALLNEI